jgi:hypothetical protein
MKIDYEIKVNGNQKQKEKHDYIRPKVYLPKQLIHPSTKKLREIEIYDSNNAKEA